jgi:hypothetical protein
VLSFLGGRQEKESGRRGEKESRDNEEKVGNGDILEEEG